MVSKINPTYNTLPKANRLINLISLSLKITPQNLTLALNQAIYGFIKPYFNFFG